MNPARYRAFVSALLLGSALAIAPLRAEAAVGSSERPGRDGGRPSSPLKHLSTTVTYIEIWLPIVGWKKISETVKVRCGPGGRDCPFTPEV